MKNLYTLVLLMLFTGSMIGQSDLVLKINHKAGDEETGI